MKQEKIIICRVCGCPFWKNNKVKYKDGYRHSDCVMYQIGGKKNG